MHCQGTAYGMGLTSAEGRKLYFNYKEITKMHFFNYENLVKSSTHASILFHPGILYVHIFAFLHPSEHAFKAKVPRVKVKRTRFLNPCSYSIE
jgi:hypothetical protein